MRKRDHIVDILKTFREKVGHGFTMIIVCSLLVAPLVPIIATLDEGMAKFCQGKSQVKNKKNAAKKNQKKKKEGKEESEFDKYLLSRSNS